MNKRLKYGLIGGIGGFLWTIIVLIIGLILNFGEWCYSSICYPFVLGEYIGVKYFGYTAWERIIPFFLGGDNGLYYHWYNNLVGII